MSATRDKTTGKWMAQVRIRDWTGRTIHKKKRGFSTKKEALDWERQVKCAADGNLGMKFSDFAAIYLNDLEGRLKRSTMATKRILLQSKILPFFGEMPMDAISAEDVRRWQNQLAAEKRPDGSLYTHTYLKSVNNQLSALFAYAVRYYKLKENPCLTAGRMGRKKAEEMQFWTPAEFQMFIGSQTEPAAYAMFMALYYTGLREGELLALTKADVDLENAQIRVNKTYLRLNRQDLIQPPKTPKSDRIVAISRGLCECLRKYIEKKCASMGAGERIFPYTKHYLYKHLEAGCRATGVKKIRVHDLRHSHASLLVEMGFSPLLIAERLGHERVQTTMEIYSHLYPNKQREVAERLNEVMNL